MWVTPISLGGIGADWGIGGGAGAAGGIGAGGAGGIGAGGATIVGGGVENDCGIGAGFAILGGGIDPDGGGGGGKVNLRFITSARSALKKITQILETKNLHKSVEDPY